VSEFDELVALDGVLMAGRLGPSASTCRRDGGGNRTGTQSVAPATYVLPWTPISLVMLSTPATPATVSSAATR
jgi:hypothetical protein